MGSYLSVFRLFIDATMQVVHTKVINQSITYACKRWKLTMNVENSAFERSLHFIVNALKGCDSQTVLE